MSNIPTLIAEKNYNALAQYCEQLELLSATDAAIELDQIYPIYLATSILTDNLVNARYIRKRILINSSHDTPEVKAIWAVIVALLGKSYPEVYQKLDNFQWTQHMIPLIADIKARTRDYMLTLIPNIYTSIELSQAQNYFGVTEERELLQELASKGWKFNESTRVLYPLKTVPATRVTADVNQFAKLADIVLNLEKF